VDFIYYRGVIAVSVGMPRWVSISEEQVERQKYMEFVQKMKQRSLLSGMEIS
jgi:hypothetical protein